MKKSVFAVCAALLVTVVGCAGTTVPAGGLGLIVTDTTEGLYANNNVSQQRTGKACNKNILGLVVNGDASIKAAKINGGITRVATIDRSFESILGVYGKACTVITGE